MATTLETVIQKGMWTRPKLLPTLEMSEAVSRNW